MVKHTVRLDISIIAYIRCVSRDKDSDRDSDSQWHSQAHSEYSEK